MSGCEKVISIPSARNSPVGHNLLRVSHRPPVEFAHQSYLSKLQMRVGGGGDGSTGPWDSRQTLDGKQQRSVTRLNNTLTSGWAGCRTQTVCVEREKRVGEVWGEFKGIVDPKILNLSLSNHPHVIQNSWNTKGLFTLATVNSPSLKKDSLNQPELLCYCDLSRISPNEQMK